VLFNHIGGSSPSKDLDLSGLDLEHYDQVMQLNVRSAVVGTGLALTHMIEGGACRSSTPARSVDWAGELPSGGRRHGQGGGDKADAVNRHALQGTERAVRLRGPGAITSPAITSPALHGADVANRSVNNQFQEDDDQAQKAADSCNDEGVRPARARASSDHHAPGEEREDPQGQAHQYAGIARPQSQPG